MIGAIITLSIVSFVLLCLCVVYFTLHYYANRTIDDMKRHKDRADFVMERLTQAIEGIEYHYDHSDEKIKTNCRKA